MKRHKGRVSEVPREEIPFFGEYGIISLEPGRLTAKHIEMVMMTMKRKRPVGAKIKAEVLAHIGVTKKPAEVRMGKGKGPLDHKIARIRENTLLFVVQKAHISEPESKYKDMLRVVSSKLPLKNKIVKLKEKEEDLNHRQS